MLSPSLGEFDRIVGLEINFFLAYQAFILCSPACRRHTAIGRSSQAPQKQTNAVDLECSY